MRTMTLRQARETAQKRQEDLERATGIDQSTISRIESGEIKRPRLRTLRKLARALGLDVAQIRLG